MADARSLQKHYDLSMLRDFLDHLLCELRLTHLELGGDSVHQLEELRSLQAVYRRKYSTSGLLEHSQLQNDVDSSGEYDSALGLFNAMFSDLRAVEIGRLEELQGLFDEALRCCGQEQSVGQTFSATELLSDSVAEPQ